MSREANVIGGKVLTEIHNISSVIKSSSIQEASESMVASADLLNIFWHKYYVPLRDQLYNCKPSFWNFLTNKRIDLSHFEHNCEGDTDIVSCPAISCKITTKILKLEKEMYVFMQEYSDALIALASEYSK